MANVNAKKEITLQGVTCFYNKETGEYFTYMNGNLIASADTDKLASMINRIQTYVVCA